MQNILKKSFFILEKYKHRLPLMFLLFLTVSLIDVIGIGMIGPFVALLAHQGKIVDDYSIFLYLIGDADNETVIAFVGILLVTIFCAKGFIAFFVQKKILSLGYEIRTSIVNKLVNSYQEMRYEDIANKDISSMIVNANTHVGLFVDSLFVPALRMSIECIVVIGIFILMAYTNIILVLFISLLLGIVLLVYFKLIKVRLYRYGRVMSEKESDVIEEIKHIMGAFREIRLLGVEEFFRNEIKRDVIEFGKAGVITRSLHLVSRYLVEATLVIFIVIIVMYMLANSETVESIYSLLGVFAVGALRLVPSFSAIGLGIANIRTADFALNSLYNELTVINKKSEKKSPEKINDSKFSRLQLRNISYSYKSDKNRTILKKINLHLSQGDFIAISGKSGSGKSTLMDIMTGMLLPTEGELLINNKIVSHNSKKTMKWWQNKCAYIPQDVFLINSTIKSNIALGIRVADIDENRLELAINGANLTETLIQNNMTIDSHVGVGGSKLSGGQRQRVALARALYAGREIIFMDEATSALDKETEEEVMNHLESLKGQITIVFITHSSAAIKNCDQVIQIVDGQLYT